MEWICFFNDKHNPKSKELSMTLAHVHSEIATLKHGGVNCLRISLNDTKLQINWDDNLEKKDENMDKMLFSALRFSTKVVSDSMGRTETREQYHQLIKPGVARCTLDTKPFNKSQNQQELYADLFQIVAKIGLTWVDWLNYEEHKTLKLWTATTLWKEWNCEVEGFCGEYLHHDGRMFLLASQNQGVCNGAINELKNKKCTLYLKNKKGDSLILFQ